MKTLWKQGKPVVYEAIRGRSSVSFKRLLQSHQQCAILAPIKERAEGASI
jgi:hypothetical protein